jgi:hypothetical protein
MMFPASSLYGTDFYPVVFLDTAVRVVAARDNTSVTVDDGSTVTTYALNGGQFQEILGSPLSLLAYHVTSNNPVTVLQFGGTINLGQGQVFGGPNSLQVLPTAAFRNEFRLAGQTTLANFVIIVAPNSAVSSVQVNGTALVTGFVPLPGGLYQFAFYPVFGPTVITGNAPLGVYSVGFGFAPVGSFAYPVAF